MNRPALFRDRASINIYLHWSQKQKLLEESQRTGKSPSALVREMINEKLGQDSDESL